jgi:DNA-binding CsgD family transcriptional regulator
VKLTKREKAICRALAGGLSNKETAALLEITPNTVSTFLQMIHLKLSVHSRGQLLRRLHEEPGLLEEERERIA